MEPRKPIVKTYWRKGNILAIVGSAKQRLREIQRFEQVVKLETEVVGITDYDHVIRIISKYCEVQ